MQNFDYSLLKETKVPFIIIADDANAGGCSSAKLYAANFLGYCLSCLLPPSLSFNESTRMKNLTQPAEILKTLPRREFTK